MNLNKIPMHSCYPFYISLFFDLVHHNACSKRKSVYIYIYISVIIATIKPEKPF